MSMIGKTLGNFTLQSLLGRGGMGVVYRAKDQRLGRDVAIKVLPEEFAKDAERIARFQREAKLLASLNHPNIASIYGLEESGGTHFLVLELIEGFTLEDRLKRGSIPVEESLEHATQIADALDKAQRKGIVHRDLKPGNIMLTKSGVKLLDFGLAKLKGEADQTSSLSQMPTEGVSQPITAQGAILGTLQYMAPEQLEGKEADSRTDIFAFGALVYEMITGKKSFEGKSQASLISAIMSAEPRPLSELQPVTPPALDRAVKKCLAKDPDDRWQSAGDLHDELKWIRETGSSRVAESRLTAVQGWRRSLPWIIAAVLCIVAIGAWLWNSKDSHPLPRAPVHLLVQLPAGAHLAVETEHPTLALSPDGSDLFFVAAKDGIRQLYRRRLADPDAVAIEGTEDAASPFFSPDGEWVAFFQNNALKKVSLGGGIPETVFPTIIPIAVNRGASWSSGNSIILSGSPNDGLHRLPISGRGVTSAEFRETTKPTAGGHAWPEALPGGEDILFANYAALGAAEPGVAIASANTPDIKSLVNVGTNPRYSATGHLLYARGRSLFGAPFSKDTRQIVGSEFKLADGLITGANGAAQFAVSANGTLAYVTGESSSGECELVWVDRKGQIEILLDNGRQFKTPRLSNDGSRLAVMSPTGSNNDIWVLNLSRGDFARWTTHSGEDFGAVWNPNGGFAFASEIGEDEGEGGPGLALMAEQNSVPRRLLKTPGPEDWDMPSSWSPDGKWLAFTAYRNFKRDICFLEADTRNVTPFLDTQFNEYAAKFSPDGRWIAYVSDRSGRSEVYVSPFSNPGDFIPISTDGGTEPLWSRDGRELFYRERNRFMTVKLAGDSGLDPGPPQPLFADSFETNDFGYGEDANYDVSPDGRRFVMIKRKNPEMPSLIHIVLNWPEAMRVSRGNPTGGR